MKLVKKPVIFIVGPTASGKSAAGIALAKRINGEIICADSQTVRRGLNIGTAKPTAEDQAEVPHHLLNIIEPYDKFSVNQFKSLAKDAVKDIQSRDKIPIIVGGTGLYIDALFFDFEVENLQKEDAYKAELEKLSVEQLQKIIEQKKFELPPNKDNPRHLIGTILRNGQIKQNKTPIKDALIFGLQPADDELKQRISNRVEQMFADGFVAEVEKIIKIYGRPTNRMDAIGYPIVIDYLDKKISLDEAKQLFINGHWQYARKQKSWFKRNLNIKWFQDADSALAFFIN